MADKFSHTDSYGKARMVDVGAKPQSQRIAIAKGEILLAPKTIKMIKSNLIKKGDVLAVAKIAGIQAAKQTSVLIPLCHPLLLNFVNIEFKVRTNKILIEATVACVGQTGVEMEALAAVSVAALTIYDMCKAVDKKMMINGVYLWQKSKQSV